MVHAWVEESEFKAIKAEKSVAQYNIYYWNIVRIMTFPILVQTYQNWYRSPKTEGFQCFARMD